MRIPHFSMADGAALAEAPRFSLGGRSIMIGPYDSPETHDKHFADTFGSGDPLLDTTDELRFSRIDSRLVSCRIGVPENYAAGDPFIERTHATSSRNALPSLPSKTNFQVVVATHTYVDPEGRQLLIFRSASPDPTERIRVANDLEMVFSQDEISGFILHNPARYLANGWKPLPPLRDDGMLSHVLANYMRLLDARCVGRLEDGDSATIKTIENLLGQVRAMALSPQQQVFADTLGMILDTFGPSQLVE